MATSLDIITGALKHLGVNAAESPITAAEAQDGLDDLNDMGAEWEESGYRVGFVPASDVNAEITLPRSSHAAFKAGLAARLAPQYGKAISPGLAALVIETKQNLAKATLDPLTVAFPDTLPTGAGNSCNDFAENNFFPQNEIENF